VREVTCLLAYEFSALRWASGGGLVGFEVVGVVSCEYRQLSPLIQYPPAKNLHGIIWIRSDQFSSLEFGSALRNEERNVTRERQRESPTTQPQMCGHTSYRLGVIVLGVMHAAGELGNARSYDSGLPYH